MTIAEIEEEIVDEFSLFDNKNDQYAYIIELGKGLPDMPEDAHTEDNIVKGCQSKVWLTTDFSEGKIQFSGDSDSTLVKGLVSLLIRVLSNKTPDEIINANLEFVDKIGLRAMLSMNRSNGLASMIKNMKMYAMGYKVKAQG